MWPTTQASTDDAGDDTPIDEEDEGFDMKEYIQLFCDKETVPFFKQADRTPPFSEWKSAHDLLAAAPEFTDYHRPPDKLYSNGKRVKLHFYFPDLEFVEKQLRKKLHERRNATIECKYGPSPDKATILLLKAQHCPEFVIHAIPPDYQLLQSIFDKATEMLHLKKDKQLVYKGESMSQVCERLRLEIMRPSRRHQWTLQERDTILSRHGHKCECGTELTKENTEIDHIVRLCDGGEDTVANAVAKCITCHAEKSEIERLGAIYRKPLESHLSRNALESFFDAPKPQQLVFGDGTPDCLKVDAIRCRSNALIHNTFPLPVASIIDEPMPYNPELAKNPYNLHDDADFYYIDAGEPLDDPCEALPYTGPNWYWRENAFHILGFGRSKEGRVDQSHILYSFKASNHEHANALVEPYAKIEAIVAASMTGQMNPKTSLDPRGMRPYSEHEIRNQAKFMILAMQGSWTSQTHHSWQVVNSLYEESCEGPVHMWRPNTDGTRRLMTRTDMLTNRTMFLIGRIALDKEHLHLWQLIFRLKQIPRAPTVHGCVNDCLYLRPSEESEDELAGRVATLITEHEWLRFKNGDLKFKLEKTKEVFHVDESGHAGIRIDEEEHLLLCDALNNKPTWKYAAPKPSRWCNAGPSWSVEILQEKAQLKEDGWSYGHWSVDGTFLVDPPWDDIAEDAGIGRGPDDTFQEEMAEKLAKTGGGMVIGRGGTGKSHLIKLLRPKLENLGYKVICIAFTHVAVANLNGVECQAHTILHLLHSFVGSKRCKKKYAIIIDECSMVPMSMWSALSNVKFLGHEIYVMGDYEGQFTPIEDSHRQAQWEQLWNSRFMLDMCNGLRIKLNKFRRQAADGRPLDFDHFQFVGSIYPGRMCLTDALMQARDQYPVAGRMCLGTTLCISHRCRVAINRAVNIAMAKMNYVEVPANPDNSNEANQPQDMRIYKDIVLIARCKSHEKHLKNGVRYKVRAITEEDDDQHSFEMIAVADDDQEIGESFIMTADELGKKMRLSYAITYFSSQARTINGPLRLAQTSNKNFTLRHLIVGLGRGPSSRDIQVE